MIPERLQKITKKLLGFALVGGLTVASTSAQDFTINGIHYNITSVDGATEKTVEIGKANDNARSCYDGDLVLSSTVTDSGIDYTITSIANSAFFACISLTSITLPNSVTSIENSAFSFCSKLTNVTLPNTLMTLNVETFANCTSLTNITLPNTLISIESSVFKDGGLTSITLPNSITSIGITAFKNCRSLATVSINKATPLTIAPNIFLNLTLSGLTLKVPTGSLAAYQNADAANAAVWRTFGTKTEVDFEFTKAGVNYVVTNTETPTVGIIKSGAADTCFTGDFALTEVVNGTPAITYAITSIAANAFEGCTGLTGFTFPSTVTSVSSATFKGCTGLATVTLPNSIREIGNNAFENCTGLTAFTINKVVPLAINANVFLNASIATATLNVPMAGVSAYEGADVWSGFSTTQTLNTESHTKENAFSISINNGRLEITQEDRALKINRIQIINLLGQVVKTSEGESSIALSNLPAGVYIVSIATKNGRFSKKFVRE